MTTKFNLKLFLLFSPSLFFATHAKAQTPGNISTSRKPAALELQVPSAFTFVAFGDTRFHDPADTEAANATVRRTLIAAIDKVNPAFVSIGGDIVYDGENAKDWEVWDSETSPWKKSNIPVYPALGNHDLKGEETVALANYFARFPELKQSRFYSVRLGKSVMLVLDSALDELAGPQGEWLKEQFDKVTDDTNFVFMIFHHPPYTSSSDKKTYGGGHTARGREKGLGHMLEARQQKMRARIIVFNGHVHNYERHEHNGVTYFVSGGGGAHAYPIPRSADDLYQDKGINYHYLLVKVDGQQASVTMHKVAIADGKATWSEPDAVTIEVPARKGMAAGSAQ